MKRTLIGLFILLAAHLFLANESRAVDLPISAISSKFADQQVRGEFEITLLVFPDVTPCKRITGIGYTVEDATTGNPLTGYPIINYGFNKTSWAEEVFKVDPRNWITGKYRVRGVTIDSCGNRSTAAQGNFITVIIPEIVQLKILSPSNGQDISATNTLRIQISYDQLATPIMIQAKKPDRLSFYSSTLNSTLLNCTNLVPKVSSEISYSNRSPSPNCTFKIMPFQGTYEFTMMSASWPEGLHPMQVTMTDTSGIEYTTSSSFLVPSATTTSIDECQQAICAQKFSGKAKLSISPKIDPRSQITIKEVGIQVDGKDLRGDDVQGNPKVKADFAGGTRGDSPTGAFWTLNEKISRFPILLDTTSWQNGSYRVSVYAVDSRGVKSTASSTISVENSGPIFDATSFRMPKGDVQENLRVEFAANSPTNSSAKIKNVQILVNGNAVTEGLTPDFKYTEVKNKSWEVSGAARFGWLMNFAKPRNILEKQQSGYFPLNVDKESASGKFLDTFQFIVTDDYGRQTTSPIYQSEVTCNPCKKLVVRDSSVSAQGGDVSKAQLISFDVDVPSQAISSVSRVRVVRDGKPVTEGLEPQFENSGIRGDGWAVDKGSKFSWKLKFGTNDQIIFDNQKGVWNVQVADDPEVDPRISSKLAFEVIDNFGRVTTSLVIPEFLITCLECEKRIKEGLKNIRLAKRYQRDAQLALDNIDTYLSTAQGYQNALNGLSTQADSDKKSSEAEIKKLVSGFKHTFPATKSRKKITVIITENRWDQTCSNQNSRPDGEKKLGAAKGAYELSEQAWTAFRGGISTVNGSIGTIKDRRSTANTALTRLKNIANSEVVSNEQAKEAKSLLDDILKYEKEASGEVNQARNGKDSAENRFNEIDKMKEIKKLVDVFFKSSVACLSGEERLSSTQGSVDGDKSATKSKGSTAILCVSPDGKQRQIVKGAAPKCPAGLVKKNY